MLTPDERERYDRQIMIGEIGEEGQEKLKRSRVVIAGAGGLGSPIAIYLTAAGIGMIRMIDHDQVALSNLNRQILHWEEDIGKKKVDSARTKLRNLNRAVEIEAIAETITEENASRLVEGCDAIVDALDNLPIRYILNRCAIEKNIPFFHGAVNGFEGRVMTIIPGETACLRCMYRGPVPDRKFPVIGVVPAVIGSIQATEVIKYLVGIGKLLTNRLLIYDGLKVTFSEFRVNRNPNCDHCGYSLTPSLSPIGERGR
ncbi:MAG: HesA/MoeB/ThiF family protein [Thermodesulfobacteriota bacterium]|nr:HesA/MoeB/ThiF family protein [Thermodesulfobacteriota bacterium]